MAQTVQVERFYVKIGNRPDEAQKGHEGTSMSSKGTSEPSASISEYIDPIDNLPSHIRGFGRRLPRIFLEAIPTYKDRNWGIDIETMNTILHPTLVMRQLKTQFWEVIRGLDLYSMQSIQVEDIIFGVMNLEQFLRFTENPKNMCWLLTPQARPETILLEMLNYGMEKLREILDLPIEKTVFHKNGETSTELNMEVMRLKLSAISMLDKRRHGDYTKKIEERSMHVRVNQSSNTAPGPRDIRELDAKIRELEKLARIPEIASPKGSFGE